MIRQTVKEAKLYEEKDKYYLDLRYEVENNIDIREYHIPKIRLPIEFATFEETIDYRPVTDINLVLPRKELLCEKGDARFQGDGFSNMHPDVSFAYRIIKQKHVEMTIEEIERKLGHKIKIVDKH